MYKSNADNSRLSYNNENSYNSYNDSHLTTSGESPAVEATKFQYWYAVFSIIRGFIARSILLYALLTMYTIKWPYVVLVLFEWVYNTYASYRSQTYFPGSMYNHIHTIQTGMMWSGDYHSNAFTTAVKIRMLLLVVSLNLSISVALGDNYSRPNDTADKSVVHTFRVMVPLILELGTVLLNTVFTLTLYTELFVRVARYAIFLILNAVVRLTDSLHNIAHRINLLPISLTTYKPYKTGLLAGNGDLESGFIRSDDSEVGNTELFDYGINSVFWPVYTFLFKWIGY